QRHEEHVATPEKNLLRAVAVVVVDVEDGDARGAAVAQRLSGDRRVVEEAIAAVKGAPGMMPGRPGERKDAALPSGHQAGAGQRHVGGGRDCPEGAGGDRRPRVEGIIAELAVDML